jgi:hypothetical protein
MNENTGGIFEQLRKNGDEFLQSSTDPVAVPE